MALICGTSVSNGLFRSALEESEEFLHEEVFATAVFINQPLLNELTTNLSATFESWILKPRKKT